jgi:hypothetical protein
MISLVFFLHMVNMGLQVEICVCKFIWKANNNIKLVIFCDILYHLNVILLQHVFGGLKSVFINSKATRQRCINGTMCLYNSNERTQRYLSNGVNCSSNISFLRNL